MESKYLLSERGNHHLYEKMLKAEMPVLEEGNMKHFHDSSMKYYSYVAYV